MIMENGKVVTIEKIEEFIQSGDHRGDANAPLVFVSYFIYRELQNITALLEEVVNALKKPVAAERAKKPAGVHAKEYGSDKSAKVVG